MVIYNAERFGLSQLHQLRGRVGRSDKKSYCFLLTGIESETSSERLTILAQNSDGFKIAEFDYKMRGSGDFLGVRQSGKFISDLGFLSYTASSVFLAKKIVDDAFAIGQNLPEIQKVAMQKYERLKDITLN
jgi:ATP-dependent DNA helicase RecG